MNGSAPWPAPHGLRALDLGCVGNRLVAFGDVHLSPRQPEKTQTFLRFLASLAQAPPSCLVCMGDLFHLWLGAGHERDPAVVEVLEAFRLLRRRGVLLVFVHGNRDFHLGAEWTQAIGAATLVPDKAVVSLGERRVGFAHGDLLCARDARYKAMRRVIRSRPAATAFRALPLSWRERIAGGLRDATVRDLAAKPQRNLQLTPQAVRRMLARTDIGVVGHVHKAQRLCWHGQGRRRWLFALGEWGADDMSWLELTATHAQLHDGVGGRRVLQAAI